MKLYAGTTEQFLTDAKLHRIAEKLRVEYVAQIGHKPGSSEVVSWQNSLTALALLIDQAELNDHGVILEYQLGNASRRLDALLTGHNESSAENAVIVELKQWGATAASNADGCVETLVGQRLRPVPHHRSRLGCTSNGCWTTTPSSTRTAWAWRASAGCTTCSSIRPMNSSRRSTPDTWRPIPSSPATSQTPSPRT